MVIGDSLYSSFSICIAGWICRKELQKVLMTFASVTLIGLIMGSTIKKMPKVVNAVPSCWLFVFKWWDWLICLTYLPMTLWYIATIIDIYLCYFPFPILISAPHSFLVVHPPAHSTLFFIHIAFYQFTSNIWITIILILEMSFSLIWSLNYIIWFLEIYSIWFCIRICDTINELWFITCKKYLEITYEHSLIDKR
jgi:hypothetical protein